MIKEVSCSNSTILKRLRDILLAVSGTKSISSDNKQIEIVNKWNEILLQLQRLHLHLFLLTGFDGELIESTSLFRRHSQGPLVITVEDEDLANFLHVRDEKSTGTQGGAAGGTGWIARTLNTSVTNEISGASLSSNQVTLPAGTYYIQASAPGHDINIQRLRWRNTTDTATDLVGVCGQNASTENQSIEVTMAGRVVIGAEKVFELQHFVGLDPDVNTFGVATNDTEVEVYADVRIWQIA